MDFGHLTSAFEDGASRKKINLTLNYHCEQLSPTEPFWSSWSLLPANSFQVVPWYCRQLKILSGIQAGQCPVDIVFCRKINKVFGDTLELLISSSLTIPSCDTLLILLFMMISSCYFLCEFIEKHSPFVVVAIAESFGERVACDLQLGDLIGVEAIA